MLAFTEESSLISHSWIDTCIRLGSLLIIYSHSWIDSCVRIGSLLIIYTSILTKRLLLFSDLFWGFFILRKEILKEAEERGVISIVSAGY